MARKEKSSEEVEPFQLSVRAKDYPSPISTTKILTTFLRDALPNIKTYEDDNLSVHIRKHGETVEELRRWSRFRATSTLTGLVLRVVSRNSLKIRMPSQAKLLGCVDHFFPARMELKVNVCDFGAGRAERREVRLGDIECEFESKPEWSQVRWIHAPLGVGLLHSSIEALFFHTGSKKMGRPYGNAGRAGWPYLEFETLDLRNTRATEDSRDLLRILRHEEKLNEVLDRGVWVGDHNKNLKQDVLWRAQYVGKSAEFWELAEADLPWQIYEGSSLNMNGPAKGVRTTNTRKNKQSLASHPAFNDAYLARNPFRTFHRDDGFLLTLSPAAGVDYLNTNLAGYLQDSQRYKYSDNYASALAQVFLEFAKTGTDTWYRRTVEWFLVYLVTEVGSAPHCIRQGFSVPSLMDAYDAIVDELKERRYDRWQRNATIDLVRAYLLCVDELAYLEELFTKKMNFFQRLRKDIDSFEEQDSNADLTPDYQEGETPWNRVAFAEHAMEQSAMHCRRLVADLRQSLDSLFQLRSIEQNELAVIADTQNKAVFVFTACTIIFLPLSFFTSYFGMNLKGIADTDLSQTWFWKVCGTVATIVVLLVCWYSFRRRLWQSIATCTRRASGQSLSV